MVGGSRRLCMRVCVCVPQVCEHAQMHVCAFVLAVFVWEECERRRNSVMFEAAKFLILGDSH